MMKGDEGTLPKITSIYEQKLASYLDDFVTNKRSYPRVEHCGKSRGLYCEQCHELLIPREDWPLPISNGTLHLPFDLDIILSDRKRSSSGLHAVVLLNASEEGRKRKKNYDDEEDFRTTITRLVDTNEGDEIPSYDKSDTYLLFPSKTSIPLSEAASKIRRLVVLDCKWTKTVSHNLPQLQNIQHVHLDKDFRPQESYYWRWHNAGKGMCSTLEAIYFSALQVATEKQLNEEEVSNLIHIMWLFAIQRSATIDTARREGKPDPFSVEGKERQRNLRRTIKGSEKHLKDIEMGKRLKRIHHEESKKVKSPEKK